MTSVAFYTLANERHFLGLVALLNSLRLQGHDERLFVADCGLAAWQRELLAPHAEVESVPSDRLPYLLKALLPRERPATTMALLDADLVVLRRLDGLLGAGTPVVAFADPVAHRFHPELSGLLGLPPLRPGTYVNSGVIVLTGERGRAALDLVAEKEELVDADATRDRGGRPENPFYYADQDVWNAVVHSSLEPAELEALPAGLAPHPPFTGLHPVGAGSMRMAYADGREPYVLHHVDRKPWLASTRTNAYSRLLPRLFFGRDVVLRLDPERVPRRFHPGAAGAVGRVGADVGAIAHGLRGRIGLRRRLAQRRGVRT